MKKTTNYIIIMLMALSANLNAQVNYLFSASSKPYVPVTGGTSPHLTTDYTNWEASDEGFASVPIGFSFMYNNEIYTIANVCVNGFITLGGTLDIWYNYPYYKNNLSYAPPYNKRPVIAPFWDDLVLPDTTNLVYKTTGLAPYRVFTIEWKQAKWVYTSPGPVLSIELKLFETTNIIEFHYKDEGNLPVSSGAFASIGITSAWANRDFISLQSTSANPKISLIKSNDSLTVKPANNQVYKFRPAPINNPQPLESSLKYTDKKVTFNLQANGVNNFEYAITQSPIPPNNGMQTTSQNITAGSLIPSKTYFLYARSKGCNSNYSQWTCTSFKTAVSPLTLPYAEDFESVTDPDYFPDNMRQQDFNDTSYYYSILPFAAAPIFPNDGNSMYNNYLLINFDINAWAFTPGIKLKAGKTYALKFGYASYWENDPSDPASLEIKYGKACGAAGMTSGTLFTKTDITNSDELLDTIINFTPGSSGDYYFGFHDKSLYLKGALILDNISIVKVSGLRLAKTDNMEDEFSSSIYPNPASEFTTLALNLETSAQVEIRLTDVLGNEVQNVCDKFLDYGNNSIHIDTKDLTPGIYLCVINVDGNTFTKKLLKN